MSGLKLEQFVRRVPKSGADYYPTPPWATRALFEQIEIDRSAKVWEPACGEGHMAETLKECCDVASATDLYDYGYGETGVDFLTSHRDVDWVITNPPFKLATEFMLHAMELNINCAMLVRLAFLEGRGRYEKIFSKQAVDCHVFSERVGFRPGVWDPNKDGGITAHAWFVWHRLGFQAKLGWIPPGCRDRFTKPQDVRWHS